MLSLRIVLSLMFYLCRRVRVLRFSFITVSSTRRTVGSRFRFRTLLLHRVLRWFCWGMTILSMRTWSCRTRLRLFVRAACFGIAVLRRRSVLLRGSMLRFRMGLFLTAWSRFRLVLSTASLLLRRMVPLRRRRMLIMTSF